MYKTFAAATFAAIASAEMTSSVADFLNEGYSTGHYFYDATNESNAICTSHKGVDISTALTLTNAQCLATNSVSVMISRAWHSNGTVDTAACGSMNNASSAGIAHRQVYMFPCPTCSASAASQVASMVNYLNANCPSSWSSGGVKYIWLDIEGSQYWLGNYSSNKTWYQNLVNACTSTAGVTCGIYASASQWSAIFGSTSYTYGNNLKLWYAHYDSVCSMSDFTPFGGWTSPWGKQYEGTHTACNTGVDSDYFPNW